MVETEGRDGFTSHRRPCSCTQRRCRIIAVVLLIVFVVGLSLFVVGLAVSKKHSTIVFQMIGVGLIIFSALGICFYMAFKCAMQLDSGSDPQLDYPTPQQTNCVLLNEEIIARGIVEPPKYAELFPPPYCSSEAMFTTSTPIHSSTVTRQRSSNQTRKELIFNIQTSMKNGMAANTQCGNRSNQTQARNSPCKTTPEIIPAEENSNTNANGVPRSSLKTSQTDVSAEQHSRCESRHARSINSNTCTINSCNESGSEHEVSSASSVTSDEESGRSYSINDCRSYDTENATDFLNSIHNSYINAMNNPLTLSLNDSVAVPRPTFWDSARSSVTSSSSTSGGQGSSNNDYSLCHSQGTAMSDFCEPNSYARAIDNPVIPMFCLEGMSTGSQHQSSLQSVDSHMSITSEQHGVQ